MSCSRSEVGRVCRRLSAGLVLCSLLLLCALPVQARQLCIATIESLPFGYADADGRPTGIMYEVANRIVEEAGMTAINRIVPYARTVHELERGDCDFVLRYTSETLEQVAVQVAPIVSLPTIVLSAAGNPFRSLAELRGKTVGVMRGGRFDDAFDADPAIKKFDTNNYEQTMRMVMAKRLDAGIGSNVGLYFNAARAGIRPEQLAPPLVLSDKTFYLHFSKKTADDKTLAALSDAVKRLQARGDIRKIIKKYVGDFPLDYSKPARP